MNLIEKHHGHDHIDMTLSRWKKERPDLNPKAKAVIGRLIRSQGLILDIIRKSFRGFYINPGEYAVLATLRVNGFPYQMPPKEIIEAVLLTSGGMSNLLERMEQKKLIKKIPDQTDRRSVQIKLTEKGKSIVDIAMTEHIKIEDRLLNSLNTNERATLEVLLKKLLMTLESV